MKAYKITMVDYFGTVLGTDLIAAWSEEDAIAKAVDVLIPAWNAKYVDVFVSKKVELWTK